MNIHDIDSARSIAERFLTELEPQVGADLVIIDSSEIDVGYLFFYTGKKFVEEGDVGYAVAGNSPILVRKRGGEASLYQDYE